MANSEIIERLLSDIKRLEELVSSVKGADIYPASLFDSTFKITHGIFQGLHSLEELQLNALREQMEEHQRLLESIMANRQAVMVEPEPQETTEAINIEPAEEKENDATTVEILQDIESNPADEEVPNIDGSDVEQPKRVIAQEASGLSLNEMLEKRNLSDFRKAFSLNDRFRFRRELFGGSEDRMNSAINELNKLSSLEESLSYLKNDLNWNTEEAPVADFIKLLEKRFS